MMSVNLHRGLFTGEKCHHSNEKNSGTSQGCCKSRSVSINPKICLQSEDFSKGCLNEKKVTTDNQSRQWNQGHCKSRSVSINPKICLQSDLPTPGIVPAKLSFSVLATLSVSLCPFSTPTTLLLQYFLRTTKMKLRCRLGSNAHTNKTSKL
jgi:hypothetical protein